MDDQKNMNIVWAVVVCLALVGFLIFISINRKVSMPPSDIGLNGTNLEGTTTDNNIMDNTNNTSAPTAQTGEVAKTGDTVSMNYTGRLQDGTVFDSNVDPKFQHVEPFVFTLGAGQVIPGWDKGIVGMKVGEKKTLTIAPADGYGANGVPGTIPPNSTLVFDVQLLAIKK